MKDSTDKSPQKSGSGLHYLIAFLCFGVVALSLASGKINRRQQAIEQQFHGIQQMQRGTATTSDESPESKPQAISLRPLMWFLVAPLVAAWLILLWRRYRSIRNASNIE
ncbi:MAG: hypothetical protein CMJ74_01810 [Planctomycetaceae bacterium]|nr:hypothetical protein [Planctomycetaceae bacterium]|tara:strand:- start:444 stop:770 length:327 start_codon:yes stop_codon:yes gene_type:complete